MTVKTNNAVRFHDTDANSPTFDFLTETTRRKSQLVSFRQGLRMVISHEPYVKLVLGFLFTSLAFMVALRCSFLPHKRHTNMKSICRMLETADLMDSYLDSQQLVLPGAC